MAAATAKSRVRVLMTGPGSLPAGWEPYDEVVTRYPADPIPDESLGAPMLYSSGTTVLSAHPAVLDVAVIGVPNDDLGEEAKAVVQLADPAAAAPSLAEDLIAYCRDRLAHFKCPRTVDFVPELPRSETGKPYKRARRLLDRK